MEIIHAILSTDPAYPAFKSMRDKYEAKLATLTAERDRLSKKLEEAKVKHDVACGTIAEQRHYIDVIQTQEMEVLRQANKMLGADYRTTTAERDRLTKELEEVKYKLDGMEMFRDGCKKDLKIITAERDRLAAIVKDIAEGEGRTTKKMDKCEHGQYGFEQCESCIADYAATALSAVKKGT